MRIITYFAAAAFTVLSLPVLRADEPKDIVDTAVEAGTFKTLVTAVKGAELVETLKGKGPFTVFAPNDEAFEKLGKEKIEELLKDKKTLASILTYHVIAGKVMAEDALKLDGKSAKTVNGKKVEISVKDGKVYLNGKAVVIKADIVTSNGVLHVIDTVILPPG